ADQVPTWHIALGEQLRLNQVDTEAVDGDAEADQRYRCAQVSKVCSFVGQMLGKMGLRRTICRADLHHLWRASRGFRRFHESSIQSAMPLVSQRGSSSFLFFDLALDFLFYLGRQIRFEHLGSETSHLFLDGLPPIGIGCSQQD